MTFGLFKQFRDNLAVGNASEISRSYLSITTRLNKDFWSSDSDTYHSRQVGSYGRGTAIRGISDLDLIFELPWELYERYREYANNGPSQLLQAVRGSLKARYARTEISADGQVVVVGFDKFVVEVVPAFWDKDRDGYIYPDTNDGGSWPICRPHREIAATDELSRVTSRNYKHACKMIRAWKNNHGINISGMLIDTLAYNFFTQDDSYNNATYSDYESLMISLFSYIGGLDHQEHWAAPGSRQRVYPKGRFQSPAKKAAAKCQEAKDADREGKKAKLYREVFGRGFPWSTEKVLKAVTESVDKARYGTEQYIEDCYPVDIRYNLVLDSNVSGDTNLRRLAEKFFWLPHGRELDFFVESCNVPKPYDLFWKVRNVGSVAEVRGIRGDIVPDGGRQHKVEKTSFGGEHYVEAYIVKDGVCVARDKIGVPIEP